MASPLELGRQQIPEIIGIIVGPSFHSQLGKFDTGCPCTFEQGGANNFVFGLSFDKNLISYGAGTKGGLWFGARLMMETRNIVAAFTEFEKVPVQSLAVREQSFPVDIPFRQEGSLRFTMLTFTPNVSWYPFGRIFVQGGIQAGLVLSSRLQHTKELKVNEVELPNGERAIVQFKDTDSNILLIEEGEAQRVNSFQLGISLATGIDIPIGERFRLTPMFHHVIPVTALMERDPKVSPDGSDPLKISTTQILLGIKMNLR